MRLAEIKLPKVAQRYDDLVSASLHAGLLTGDSDAFLLTKKGGIWQMKPGKGTLFTPCSIMNTTRRPHAVKLMGCSASGPTAGTCASTARLTWSRSPSPMWRFGSRRSGARRSVREGSSTGRMLRRAMGTNLRLHLTASWRYNGSVFPLPVQRGGTRHPFGKCNGNHRAGLSRDPDALTDLRSASHRRESAE